LTEVLDVPIVSSTTSFPAPTSSFERAVGLEVFQHAEIGVNLMAREKQLKIGEDLELEMEFVNAGEDPAIWPGLKRGRAHFSIVSDESENTFKIPPFLEHATLEVVKRGQS
jgi:hypothetical protein